MIRNVRFQISDHSDHITELYEPSSGIAGFGYEAIVELRSDLTGKFNAFETSDTSVSFSALKIPGRGYSVKLLKAIWSTASKKREHLKTGSQFKSFA